MGSLHSHADSKPDWVTKFQHEDSTHKYFIGRSSGAPSEAVGVSEATRDAIEQSILECFGFKTNVSRDTYETGDKAATTKRFQEISRDIQMRGWEQMGVYAEERDGRYSAWVLYRYSKTEIASEKARLASVKEEEKTIKFNDAGIPSDRTKGGIEVSTRPVQGAEVLIDGKPLSFQVTPLRIFGIKPGPHLVRIEHPQFSVIEETVIVTPGNVTKLNKILLKATGRVRVTSNPSNANVIIDGKPVGVTSTGEIEVPAGEPVKIELSHAEAESKSETVEVERDEVRTVNFDLTLKPAYIESIVTEPRDVSIILDGVSRGATPLHKPIKVRAEKPLTLTLEKGGFVTETREITLRGGEKRKVPTIKLTRISELEKRRAREQEEEERIAREEAAKQAHAEEERREKIKNPKIILSALLGFGGSSLASPDYPLGIFGVRAQYMPFRSFGLTLDITGTVSSAEYRDATVGTLGASTTVGAVVFLTENIFLSPQWVYRDTRITANYKGGGSGAVSAYQTGAGIVVGCRWWLDGFFTNFINEGGADYRIGFSVEAGLHNFYSTSAELSGTTPASLKAGVLLGF